MINADLCACRCCSPKPCTPRVLSEVFEVNRCWYNGGRDCLNQCKTKYPNECRPDNAFAVPFCQSSSTISLNFFLISHMGFVQSLFHSDVNPLNHKSRTLPLLNVVDKYGRTFHLSWIGFFVAFLSWFAFPPLIHDIIRKDLQLTHSQIANSNIIALLATFLVRLFVGPLCDRYGPRYVMIGCLLAGAIPTALTPLIKDATGLIIIRFFVGILGGTFVPCQVWTSQFFDKNIIGLTNALAAGLGNAGGGVIFFLMPAVVFHLMYNHDISQYWAWRIAFPMGPLVIILCVTIITLIFGHDTPTGPWSTRHLYEDRTVDDGQIAIEDELPHNSNIDEHPEMAEITSKTEDELSHFLSNSQIPPTTHVAPPAKEFNDVRIVAEKDELPRTSVVIDLLKIASSSQTLLVAIPYLCSFGSELAVEGVISDFYIQTTKVYDGKVWNSQTAGNWAAIFGLLNIVTRPLGGYISDVLYRYKGLNAKKWWIIFLGVIQAIFFICIGLTKLKIYTLISLMTGLAIFIEAANGAVFALVPSIHPKFNGVVSGVTGAFGNVGGVLFCLIFRYLGTDYYKALWIIGVCCLGCNLGIIWIPLKNTNKQEHI
ncbi:hypothetical protein I4U23_015979 [Adineta vaga]|nr:hypothetical protein I4U23_015979 [Adineta vaga]